MSPFEAAVQALASQKGTDVGGPATPVVTVTKDGHSTVVGSAGPPLAVQVYSPVGLVEFLIANPTLTLTGIAKAYGRTMSWLSQIVASDAFQRALDPRRDEVLDPFFTATLDERFRALALRSGAILLDKLNSAEASEHLVLKATELSIKALGMGIAPPDAPAYAEPKMTVAEKMELAMAEMDKRMAAKGILTVEVVEAKPAEPKNG